MQSFLLSYHIILKLVADEYHKMHKTSPATEEGGGGGLSYVKGSYVSPRSISIPAFYEIKVETL